ncbi:uncharacterized protein Eint_080350 [Encephalitozoon intestinalis ATCC 50506]|uniref:Uncharacterized protein n=1 Tax=Encephalitozoon intestinalis (strain ATCC 50506) TaxID=876142 RepID=E0S8H7_ENCIT|nr:uncharacterized protein Eint_080350 [Encephalitozoon intestinalis ATCC 50506]ADM11971.1 hypothetical protein Eint_080350 [Encephalitozoon intestinalis ATCC 50506]UTX45756.1 hypothetical protein GPK93_08g13300 [Encephalitozoon intestinalis]
MKELDWARQIQENIEELHEKNEKNIKEFHVKVRETLLDEDGEKSSFFICRIGDRVNIHWKFDIDYDIIFSFILILKSIMLGIFKMESKYFSFCILMTAIVFSWIEAVERLHASYRRNPDIRKLLEFKNLISVFQIAFGIILTTHLLYIQEEESSKRDARIYSLMVSLVYLFRCTWKSSFFLQSDDIYQFLYPTALTIMFFMAFLSWRNKTMLYDIPCALISILIALKNYVGKPVSLEKEGINLLSIIFCSLFMLGILATVYTASGFFKIFIPRLF